MRSPCIGCEREHLSKDGCSEECEVLMEWQEADCPGVRKRLKHENMRRLMGEDHCVCGGLLVFEEGVWFCRDCLEVYVRARGFSSDWKKDFVEKMQALGLTFRAVAAVMGVTEKHLRRNLAWKRKREEGGI